MANRVANIFILTEGDDDQSLVRQYLRRVDRQYARRIRPIPVAGKKGCGSQYVREQFPVQVNECRKRIARGASCMLIVLTDADNLTTHEREKTLHAALVEDGQGLVTAAEPIIILIPKWQVETWIKCLLGESVEEDCKKTDQPAVTNAQIADAASTLYKWARPNARVGTTCVDSLKAALPRWRRIG